VIRNHRTVGTRYYNHNGVYLNYLSFAMGRPLVAQMDDSKRLIEAAPPRKGLPPDLGLKTFMLLKQEADETVVFQPDFRRLEVEGARLCVMREPVAGKKKAERARVAAVISQSWHQGWKPVLQKAKDYDDRLVLVCDTADWKRDDGEKASSADWIPAIEGLLSLPSPHTGRR
jgi:hypothetical protein